MSKTRTVQNSFTAGELSPRLTGRFDLDKYHAGCRTLCNFIARPEGGVMRRPGIQCVADTDSDDTVSRLIPFIYSSDDSYMLMFGDYHMHFFRGWEEVDDGAGSPYGIDNEYPAEDLAAIKYAQDADVMFLAHPDHRPQKLSRYDHDNWTMTDMDYLRGPFLTENDTDTTIEVKAYEIDDVDDSAETFTITDDGDLSDVFVAGAVFNVSDSTGNDGEWTVDTTSFSTPDFVITVTGDITDATVDGTIAPDLTEGGIVELKASADVFESGHEEALWAVGLIYDGEHDSTNFVSTAVESTWDTGNSVSVALGQTLRYSTHGTLRGTMSLEISYDNEASWQTLYQVASDDDSNVTDSYVEEIDPSKVRWRQTDGTGNTNCWGRLSTYSEKQYGYVRIQTVRDARLAVAVVTDDLASAGTPTKDWSEGAWSDVRGWPSAIAFYEQRLWFGGTAHQPNTVWSSVSYPGGDFDNFLAGTDDDDAIIFTIAESEDPIMWLAGERQLIMGSSGGPYAMAGGSGDEAMTPTNVRAVVQDVVGASEIQAVKTSLGLLYVERGLRRISEFGFSWESDKFVTANLARLAEHITEGGISAVAFQKRPEHILWCVTNDGRALGMTYLRSENIICWHEHTAANGGAFFESLGIKPGKASTGNEDEDEIWFVLRGVNDSGETQRYVVRMAPWDYGDDQADGFFVDCGKTQESVGATTMTGLDHLEGQTVAVCADGAVQTSKVVSGGSITLDHPADVVHAGMPYTSTLIPTRPADGSLAIGSTRRGVRVAATFYKTNSCKFGTSTDDLDTIAFRDSGDSMDTAVPLFSGTKQLDLDAGYDINGDLIFVCDAPLPCEISCLTTTWETD